MMKDMKVLLSMADKPDGGDEKVSKRLVAKFGSRHLLRTVCLSAAFVFLVYSNISS